MLKLPPVKINADDLKREHLNKSVKNAGLNVQVDTYIKFLKDKGEDDIVIQKNANTLRKTLGLKEKPIKISLTQKIRDWIDTVEDEFYTRDIFEELNIPNTEKAQVSQILTRLIEKGIIERSGKRTGQFRKPDRDLIDMDLFNAVVEIVDITLPFDLHKIVNIMPGNIIIIAGEVNQGKTAFLLNIIADNMNHFKIHYFNSEMGEGELKNRLEKFNNMPFNEWKAFYPHERNDNFADVIFPGRGVINIIDYLELYEDFWIVAKRINEIYKKLDGAIAIIALQKNPEVAVPLGGYRGLEKARLALSIERGKLRILKAKNWIGNNNPNGTEILFNIINGCELIRKDEFSENDG